MIMRPVVPTLATAPTKNQLLGQFLAASSERRARGRAWRRAADQPHQLRDLCAADLARAVALQGDLGGGRGPLPQSRRGFARRLRRTAGSLLRAPQLAHAAARL